jgi:hypothetical protein
VKLKVLLIAYICIVQISLAQNINKYDIIKFKVKSITTIDGDGRIKFTEYFNDKGDLIKKTSPNDGQTTQIDRELFYNDSSLLLEERTYTSNGDINTIWKYSYNSKNQLEKKESIFNNNVDASWIYQYDLRGNKISEIQASKTMGNSITKYKYDDYYLLIQEDKENNSIGKEERITYKYSEKRQVIEKKTKSYYFNTTITQTYLYDETGKLTKLVEKSSNGVSSTTIYRYDDKGLLVSEIWESSLSNNPQKTTYQINFE